MSTNSAQRSWEAENDVLTIDPTANALYKLPDHASYQRLLNDQPWKNDLCYFTHVRISALALLKMTTHARSGGEIEIMGLMTGYVAGTSLIVTDAFRLPVEGTETRVNAGADAEEYQVNFGIASREGGGQAENSIGWYHSHPGYGCWLSGIDVSTQRLQQQGLGPFVAVVIDPERTVSGGKVEIGAFRTYPKGQEPPTTHKTNALDDSDDFQSIPTGKIEDFGAQANAYYALEVSHFKSSLDTQLLNLLWNKYWVATLSQSPLFTNRDYMNKQIDDHAVKIKQATRKQRGNAFTGLVISSRSLASGEGANKHIKVVKDAALEQVVRNGNRIAHEEMAGLMASEVKRKLFSGVVEEAMGQEMNGAQGAS